MSKAQKKNKEDIPKVSTKFLLNDSATVKSGWLFKMGGHIRTVKKRYVILHGNSLFYFKSRNEALAVGMIKVSGNNIAKRADSEIKKEFALSIQTPDRKFYMWSPVGSDDIDDWIANINQASKNALEEGDKPISMPPSTSSNSHESNSGEDGPTTNRPKRAETATIMSYILNNKNERNSNENSVSTYGDDEEEKPSSTTSASSSEAKKVASPKADEGAKKDGRSKSFIQSELQVQKDKLQENRNQLKQMQQEEKARKLKMLQEQAQLNAKLKQQQQQQQQQRSGTPTQDIAPASASAASPSASDDSNVASALSEPVPFDSTTSSDPEPVQAATTAVEQTKEEQTPVTQEPTPTVISSPPPPETSSTQSEKAEEKQHPSSSSPSTLERKMSRADSFVVADSNAWVKAEDTYVDEGIVEGVKTFIVDQNAADNDANSMKSLEEALAVCNHGDTIFVKAGTYAVKKSIVIDKCVQITGENPKSTIFASKFDKCLPLIVWSATLGRISLLSFVVHVRNRPKQGPSGGGKYATDSVLQVTQGQLRIEECDILVSDSDESREFVKVDGVSTSGKAQCWMNRCTIDGATAHGISMFGSSQVSLDSTSITNSCNAGVACSGKASLTMMRGRIDGVSSGSGIVALDSSRIVLDEAEISKVARNGLSMMGRSQFLLRKCKIHSIEGSASACIVSHGAVRGSCEDCELSAPSKSELCICVQSADSASKSTSAPSTLAVKAIELSRNVFVLGSAPSTTRQSLKPILCSGSSVRIDMKANSFRTTNKDSAAEEGGAAKILEDQKVLVLAKDNALVKSVA